MKKITSRELLIPVYILLVLVLVSSLIILYRLVVNGNFFWDYSQYYYPQGQLFWNKIDPSKDGGAAFPWAYVLDLFYVIPFFPLDISVIWGTIVYILVAGTLAAVCMKMLNDRLLGIVIVGAMSSLWYGFSYGNYGAMCCMFAIFSICLASNHKFFSGLFLALALMKPHATALIVFPLLLCGYIEVDIIAAVIVGAATIFFGIYIGENPLDKMLWLLSFGKSSGGSEVSPMLCDMTSGITDFLFLFGYEKSVIYITSVIVAAVYCIILCMVLYNHNVKSLWEISVPFAIGLSFWFYKNPQDEFILFIPLIILVMQLKKNNKKIRCNLFEAFEILVLSIGSIGCVLIIKEGLELLGIVVSSNVFCVIQSVFHGMVAIIGIDICRRMVREKTDLSII